MFYLHHTPVWLRWLFPPGLLWQGAAPQGNEVFLTFDDGPHAEATPFVLDQLSAANMKGSFFCIGKNVVAYPHLFSQIIESGHTVANHTMHHVNGKLTDAVSYADNVAAADAHIHSNYFRPPYGQITSRQASAIKSRFSDMQIVMWSVLSGDFDTSKTGAQCFEKTIRHIRPGSIIVFHDSGKAMPRLAEALPRTLHWLRQNGLQSCALPKAKGPLPE